MERKIGLVLVILSMVFVLSCSNVNTSDNKQTAGRFEIAKAQMFDDPIWHGAADPTPIWNAAEKKWFIYYTQRRAALSPSERVEYCHGSAVGIATSTDGVEWKYEGICHGDDGLDAPIEAFCSWWAPCVVFSDGTYHLFISWVDGIYKDWRGKRFIKHFTSRDGRNFKYQSTLNLSSENCIDPCVWKAGGKWLMLYKDEAHNSHSWMAESRNLNDWKVVGEMVSDCTHEAPFVWNWMGKWFLIVDAWDKGLRIYESKNGIDGWSYNNTILSEPGKRDKDNFRGAHPGILTTADGAYVIYHVHYQPPDTKYGSRRTVLQIAQLELKDGKVVCERDRYYKP